MEVTIFVIAIIVAFIYWLIGLTGTWKRAFWLILFSFVAFIIAFQHSNSLLELVTNNSLFYKKSEYSNGAFSYLLLFGLIFIILIVLYHILWANKQQNKSNSEPGLVKFAQSLLTALVGWGVGVILAIGIMAYISGQPENASLPQEGIAEFLQLSANFMIRVGRWFSVKAPPDFLTAWLVK